MTIPLNHSLDSHPLCHSPGPAETPISWEGFSEVAANPVLPEESAGCWRARLPENPTGASVITNPEEIHKAEYRCIDLKVFL